MYYIVLTVIGILGLLIFVCGIKWAIGSPCNSTKINQVIDENKDEKDDFYTEL